MRPVSATLFIWHGTHVDGAHTDATVRGHRVVSRETGGSVPIRRHRDREPAELGKSSTARPTPCRPPRGYSVHAATGRCSTRTLKPRPWWLWRSGPLVTSTSMYRQSDVSFCDLRSGSPPTRASSYMVAAISIDEDPAGTVSRETIIPTAAPVSREELHPASDEGSG